MSVPDRLMFHRPGDIDDENLDAVPSREPAPKRPEPVPHTPAEVAARRREVWPEDPVAMGDLVRDRVDALERFFGQPFAYITHGIGRKDRCTYRFPGWRRGNRSQIRDLCRQTVEGRAIIGAFPCSARPAGSPAETEDGEIRQGRVPTVAHFICLDMDAHGPVTKATGEYYAAHPDARARDYATARRELGEDLTEEEFEKLQIVPIEVADEMTGVFWAYWEERLRPFFAPDADLGDYPPESYHVQPSGRGLKMWFLLGEPRAGGGYNYPSARNARLVAKHIAWTLQSEWPFGEIEVLPKEDYVSDVIKPKVRAKMDAHRVPDEDRLIAAVNARGVRLAYARHPQIFGWSPIELHGTLLRAAVCRLRDVAARAAAIRGHRAAIKRRLKSLHMPPGDSPEVRARRERRLDCLLALDIDEEMSAEQVDLLARESEAEIAQHRPQRSKSEAFLHMRPCLRARVDERRMVLQPNADGELNHEYRFAFAFEFIWQGGSVDDLVSFFEGLRGYDRNTTRMYATRIAEEIAGGRKQWNCESLRGHMGYGEHNDAPSMCEHCPWHGEGLLNAAQFAYAGERFVNELGRVEYKTPIQTRDEFACYLRNDIMGRHGESEIYEILKPPRAGATTTVHHIAKSDRRKVIDIASMKSIYERTYPKIRDLWARTHSHEPPFRAVIYADNRSMCPNIAMEETELEATTLEFQLKRQARCQSCPEEVQRDCPMRFFERNWRKMDAVFFCYDKIQALLKSRNPYNTEFLHELFRWAGESRGVLFLDEVSHICSGMASTIKAGAFLDNQLTFNNLRLSEAAEMALSAFQRIAETTNTVTTRIVHSNTGYHTHYLQTNRKISEVNNFPATMQFFRECAAELKRLEAEVDAYAQANGTGAFSMQLDNRVILGGHSMLHHHKVLQSAMRARSALWLDQERQAVPEGEVSVFKVLHKIWNLFAESPNIYFQRRFASGNQPTDEFHGMQRIQGLVDFLEEQVIETNLICIATDATHPVVSMQQLFRALPVHTVTLGNIVKQATHGMVSVVVHPGFSFFNPDYGDYGIMRRVLSQRATPETFVMVGNTTIGRRFGISRSKPDELASIDIKLDGRRMRVPVGVSDWFRGIYTVGVPFDGRHMIVVGGPNVPHGSMDYHGEWFVSAGYSTGNKYDCGRTAENNNNQVAFVQGVFRVVDPEGIRPSRIDVYGVRAKEVEQWLGTLGIPMPEVFYVDPRTKQVRSYTRLAYGVPQPEDPAYYPPADPPANGLDWETAPIAFPMPAGQRDRAAIDLEEEDEEEDEGSPGE